MARSNELEQPLTLLINESSKRKSDGDRGVAQIGTARVQPPESGRASNYPKCVAGELIAVVDDDECARSGLRILIESLGYRVAAFASAAEYLAAGMGESAACLILDVYMPDMSGPDLQDHLIADRSCPPIVFATGRFEEHVRKRVIEAGALGYLKKPCDERALLDCIAKVIRTTA